MPEDLRKYLHGGRKPLIKPKGMDSIKVKNSRIIFRNFI